MRYSIAILCVLFISCSGSERRQKKEQKVTTIQVNPDEAEPVRMSEYFSDINYFYLESPENRPIGRIWKIMIRDNYIALYDRARGSIWVYNKEGEYINEVEIPVGKGPGELTNPEDVIFTKDHNFHILGKLKIVVYNLKGNFVGETEYYFWVYNFTYNSSTGEYIGYAGNSLNRGRLNDDHAGQNLLYFNEDGRITESFLPIGEGKEQIGFGIPNNFPMYNEKQLFIPHLVDTIYVVYDNYVTPRYALDFGDHAIPQEVFDRRDNYGPNIYDWSDFKNKEIEEKNYASNISVFAETDSFVYFRFIAGDKIFGAIYNKDKRLTRVVPDKMINDIDYGLTTYMYEAHDNALYTVIEANALLRHLNDLYENEPEKYSSPKMKELRNLAHSMDENRNPLLMIATFKETETENNYEEFQ